MRQRRVLVIEDEVHAEGFAEHEGTDDDGPDAAVHEGLPDAGATDAEQVVLLEVYPKGYYYACIVFLHRVTHL